jgi:uncharacterized protein
MYNHPDQSYLDRPLFMSEETFRKLIERVQEYCSRRRGHKIALTFHGGEPMLMGLEMFERFASMASKTLSQSLAGLSLQTNGTLVTDRWIEALHRYGVSVGVSIDGPASIHDRVRVDHAGRGSHDRAVKGFLQLHNADPAAKVLCVVNPRCSGLDAYQHFRSLGIKHMDFLLPDASHDSKPLLYNGCGPTPVSDYLIPIFDAWFAEDDPTVSIRIFEDIIRALLGGEPLTDCIGNPLSGYLVIDTDGSIQLNDALKVCDEGISEGGLNIFEHSFDELRLAAPLFRHVVLDGVPLSATCQKCPERDVCAGGYLPHRYSRSNGFDNPSIWCRDLLTLIGHIRSYVELELAA